MQRGARALVLCADRGVPIQGPSGCSAHLRGIVGALVRAGCDVELAAALAVDHRGAAADAPGVRTVTRAPRSWRRLGPFREWGETLDSRALSRATGACDLIWERYSLFCDGGLRLARDRGCPHIVELNAPLSRERGSIRDRRRAVRVERTVLRAATRVVAVSRWLADWAVEQGCDPARVRHVPNGTDATRPGRRAETREALGLEGPVVGFVGSLKPWHGVERIAALLDALPEATALVVGDGPTPLPDHPRLRARGRVDPRELPDLVAAMDVGLAPYPLDAPPWFCPLKILDYRAQGVPVLASDTGDCQALVGRHGRVLCTDDPAAWAEAARALLDAPRHPDPRPWDDVVAEAAGDLLPAIT